MAFGKEQHKESNERGGLPLGHSGTTPQLKTPESLKLITSPGFLQEFGQVLTLPSKKQTAYSSRTFVSAAREPGGLTFPHTCRF